jgi:hypothetical protein
MAAVGVAAVAVMVFIAAVRGYGCWHLAHPASKCLWWQETGAVASLTPSGYVHIPPYKQRLVSVDKVLVVASGYCCVVVPGLAGLEGVVSIV